MVCGVTEHNQLYSLWYEFQKEWSSRQLLGFIHICMSMLQSFRYS